MIIFTAGIQAEINDIDDLEHLHELENSNEDEDELENGDEVGENSIEAEENGQQ